jgi:hypothetical protein
VRCRRSHAPLSRAQTGSSWFRGATVCSIPLQSCATARICPSKRVQRFVALESVTTHKARGHRHMPWMHEPWKYERHGAHTHYRKHSRKARSHSNGMHTCMTCWSKSEAHIISSLTFGCRWETRVVELADIVLHLLPHPRLFFSLVLVAFQVLHVLGLPRRVKQLFRVLPLLPPHLLLSFFGRCFAAAEP